MRSEQIHAPPRLCLHYLWKKHLCLSTRMNLKAVHFFPPLLTEKRLRRVFLDLFSWFPFALFLRLQLKTRHSGGRAKEISQLACCDKWKGDRDDMETDHKSTQEIQHKTIFFLFFSSLSSSETALGLIWFGFSVNYYSLDPVSVDKAPKCPSCILILPMNIQQLALISLLFSHLYWYLTVLVIMCWRKMWQREVALIYDPIGSSATHFSGLKGASSLSTIGMWLKFIKVKTTLIY